MAYVFWLECGLTCKLGTSDIMIAAGLAGTLKRARSIRLTAVSSLSILHYRELQVKLHKASRGLTF